MKAYLLLLLALFLLSPDMTRAQMSPNLYVDKDDTLPYLLKSPKTTSEKKKFPLIIWLHGSGERGTDNKKQYCNGLETLDTSLNSEEFQAFLCAPQCPDKEGWSYYDIKQEIHSFSSQAPLVQTRLIGLINQLIEKNPIDPDRIYLIGLSMGGYGVWDLLTRYRGTFAAAIPICGGGDPKQVGNICKVPIWAFHGEEDDVVKVSNSISVMKAIADNNCTNNSMLKVLPAQGHGIWYSALKYPGLLEWLFDQRLN